MVYLPSDVIMNIISFLGGEKYNISVESESTMTKISRQSDARLKKMMIDDVAFLFGKMAQEVICEQHEEIYQKIIQRRYICFTPKRLIFSVLDYKFTIGICISDLVRRRNVFERDFFLDKQKISTYSFFRQKNLCTVRLDEENTFIWSDDFLSELTVSLSNDLCEIFFR